MQPVTAILFGVLGMAFIASLWDAVRRYTNLQHRLADAIASYETTLAALRHDIGSYTLDQLKLVDMVSIQKRDSALHDTYIEDMRKHLNGIQRELFEMREKSKEDPELTKTIAELTGRCDKNSQAIVNTAADMQKLLNEKFTALKLALTGK